MADGLSGFAAATATFRRAWCGTGLGVLRPCRATYDDYPYDTLPALPALPDAAPFSWLGGLGTPDAERAQRLRALADRLSVHGLALPADFAAFAADRRLHDELDRISVTACWSDISDPLPSPVEPGAFLVRFLRDQQDCVTWYHYLRPCGETFVVFSPIEYGTAYEERRTGEPSWVDLDDAEQQRAAICWCAPTFEDFARRFWTECRLWRALHGSEDEMTRLEPHVRAYLDAYLTQQDLGS